MNVGFVGLSHLGLISGAVLASRGFRVVGFDPDQALVAQLQSGEIPVHETGLPEILSGTKSAFTFHSDPKALENCEIVYLARDIPTDKNNVSSPAIIYSLLDTILPHLMPQAVLVLHSQVSPGFCRQLKQRLSDSGQPTLRLYYQVETLIFGQAVERALRPERYIVGAEDPEMALPAPLATVLEAGACPVLCMKYESAELSKIAINFFLVSSVSTTNTLAELCERIGADWNEIAPTLRLDRRIGPHAYLAPGLGLSGGNLERDLMTVRALAAEHGTDDSVVQAWLENSAHRKSWPIRALIQGLRGEKKKATIAVWGLAYKPGTHSIKNSPSLQLLESLRGYALNVYDPIVQLDLSHEAFSHVRLAQSALDCCLGADALIVMTPWEEFRSISLSDVATKLREKFVVDPFGVFSGKEAVKLGFRYDSLGK